jgi:hypothetical protein
MKENDPETYRDLRICRKPAEEIRSADLSRLFDDEDRQRRLIG